MPSRIVRVVAGVLAVAAACVGAVTVGAPGAGAADGAVAAPDDEAAFVSAINRIRTDRGLAPLQVDGELARLARAWSFTMAAAGGISHRPDLRAGVSSDWSSLGENVGVGPTVDELMRAFVNSPGHYKNLVEPKFTHVGVGAVRVGELIYTAHEFMTIQGGRTAPAPAPPPAARAPIAPRSPSPARTVMTKPQSPGIARAVAAAPSRAGAVTPPPPPPAPTPRVADVIERLRGRAPAL